MALRWNQKQLNMLAKMGLPFDPKQELGDDQLEQLYDVIPDYLEFEKEGNPTPAGAVVEDMLTLVAAEMEKRNLLA